jgi:hypothetical protein
MKTIDFSDVREYYERNRPAGHWFDAGTLRLFKCRLPKIAYETTRGVLFISSEADYTGERRYYNVRRQLVDGDIVTLGQFNAYRTRAEAFNAVRQLDKGF